MNRKHVLRAAMLSVAIANAITGMAQEPYYDFEVDALPYTSLFDTPVDLKDTVLTQNQSFATGYEYSLFGEAPSTYYEAGYNNGFVVSTSDDFAYTYDIALMDLTKRDSTSALIITEAFMESDTVLVAEWHNMGLLGHDSSDFVNLQMRFYKHQDKVEMHYGPQLITDNKAFRDGADNGPAINFARRHTSFTPAYDNTWLSGDPQSPVRFTGTAYTALDGMPAEGTVYRFYRKQDSIPTDTGTTGFNTIPLEQNLKLYPNPAESTLRIEGMTQDVNTIRIYDVQGRELITQKGAWVLDESLSVDISKLDQGMYVLMVSKQGISISTARFEVLRE